MYLKYKDGLVVFPYSLGQLKKDNPNVSLPATPTREQLAAYNMYEVAVGPNPGSTDVNYAVLAAPFQDSADNWYVSYNVIQRPQDVAEENIRKKRDEKLATCDWTQIPDSPLTDEKKAEWATYRQALRDITADSDFPYNITWPTEP